MQIQGGDLLLLAVYFTLFLLSKIFFHFLLFFLFFSCPQNMAFWGACWCSRLSIWHLVFSLVVISVSWDHALFWAHPQQRVYLRFSLSLPLPFLSAHPNLSPHPFQINKYIFQRKRTWPLCHCSYYGLWNPFFMVKISLYHGPMPFHFLFFL